MVDGEGDVSTIFALSSGPPPAAIAVVRISGPAAAAAVQALAGRVPEPRRASLAWLCDPGQGERLDRALVFWFPGPRTATGEDLAELHLHGGRSVTLAVQAALSRIEGLRPALPGEFTRRAFANGVLDLAEAEGLADLLAAETESQRRAALALASGALSRQVEVWRIDLLSVAASIEAMLDFADEGDVGEGDTAAACREATRLADEIEALLARPPAERLRDGIRVILAGPPNVGKSTLLNRLAGRDAAITAPSAGTTRDLIEVPVAINGVAYVLTDTAGLRDGDDPVERIGIERAEQAIAAGDILLWLGDPVECPAHSAAIRVHARADIAGEAPPAADIAISAKTGQGMEALYARLHALTAGLLPREGELAVNARQRGALADCVTALRDMPADPILLAESLRAARGALDRITGRAGVEDMLDTLFGRFCIGK